MIRRYLREHLPLAGLLALFAGTFALVLSLYHLPTEPVAYASALCAVMGLIALIWGFVRYRRAHQARAHVLNAPHLLLDELPSPRTLSEADDQAIMQRLLHASAPRSRTWQPIGRTVQTTSPRGYTKSKRRCR